MNKNDSDGYETPEEDTDSVENNAPNTPNSLSDAFSKLGIKRSKYESDDNDEYDEELIDIYENINQNEENQDEDEYIDRYNSKRYKQNNRDDQEEMPPTEQNGGEKKRKNKTKSTNKKKKYLHIIKCQNKPKQNEFVLEKPVKIVANM
jgi:hypothetical protein